MAHTEKRKTLSCGDSLRWCGLASCYLTRFPSKFLNEGELEQLEHPHWSLKQNYDSPSFLQKFFPVWIYLDFDAHHHQTSFVQTHKEFFEQSHLTLVGIHPQQSAFKSNFKKRLFLLLVCIFWQNRFIQIPWFPRNKSGLCVSLWPNFRHVWLSRFK